MFPEVLSHYLVLLLGGLEVVLETPSLSFAQRLRQREVQENTGAPCSAQRRMVSWSGQAHRGWPGRPVLAVRSGMCSLPRTLLSFSA